MRKNSNFNTRHKRKQTMRKKRKGLTNRIKEKDVESIELNKKEAMNTNMHFARFVKLLRGTKDFYQRSINTISGAHSAFHRAIRGEHKPESFLPKCMGRSERMFYNERVKRGGLSMTNRERFYYFRNKSLSCNI